MIKTIQAGVIGIEEIRDLWIDSGQVITQNVDEMIRIFTQVYSVFIQLLLPIDIILQDQALVSIPY